MLPLRAQKLISEYSKPVTRPDWRTLCPLTFKRYYKDILRNRDRNKIYENVYWYFVDYGEYEIKQYKLNHHISAIYSCINLYGIKKCSQEFNINEHVLKEIKYEYSIRPYYF
jgi:hypothetical protein